MNGGTVFKINADGTRFATLYKFTALDPYYPSNSDGANPGAGLTLSGSTLYGTAYYGGNQNNGTIFALSLPVPPSIGLTMASKQIILSWPIASSNYILQMTTNFSTGSWGNITNGITIVGGNYLFTNTLNGNVIFFRLKQ